MTFTEQPARHPARAWCGLLAWAAGLAAPAATIAADPGPATASRTELALRYRYEFVAQDGYADEAHASTLRLRLGHRTAPWHALSGLVEFDAVRSVIADDYNSGAGTSSARRNRYPVVADPDYTELNQLYVDYRPAPDTRIRLGRQRILLDNQRFVGGVGWRQNEQTYDAVSIQTDAPGKATLFYSYVTNVNRIFGDDVADGDHDNDTHLFNLAHPLGEAARLNGYLYAIDNDDVHSFSTTTAGLRLSGKTKLDSLPFGYTLEHAWQRDAAGNTVDFSARYFRIDTILTAAAADWSLGFESLSGASTAGRAFRTPLATLHAFNGWADQFLATPNDGLEDWYVGVAKTLNPWSLAGTWHRFGSEVGGRDYGSEVDFSATRKFGNRYAVLVKLALFDADDSAFDDTSKLWLMLSAEY